MFLFHSMVDFLLSATRTGQFELFRCLPQRQNHLDPTQDTVLMCEFVFIHRKIRVTGRMVIVFLAELSSYAVRSRHECIGSTPLIQAYPKEFYKLLLRAVQDLLMQRHKESFGCVPGLLVFLHTWGQRMKRHVHAHVILTGGGLSLDGTRWVQVDHRSPLLSREALASCDD